ncbi:MULTISPECIES: rhomboid family intramembrane serine protease [unclassified Ekhidna]|uniref:rhomboid family intramembrane serine protease n=1 Tax=unclassified Ekhidna TaxID=2632188 RepID=UPI0032DF266F
MFTRNLFTTPFIHNGLDHILFVSVLGFLLMVQSYETHFGTRKTIIMFFLAYLIVAPFFAALYSLAINFYPGSEFLNYVMSRNWVGGSIGMFQLYGALATLSRRPLIMLAAPVVFETFNLLVIEIHPQISIMHLTCTFVGYGLSSGINTK